MEYLEELKLNFIDLKDYQNYIICEKKFDYGINFLHILKLWQENVTTEAKLIYISCIDKIHSVDTLINSHSQYPELSWQSKELIAQYYLILDSNYRLYFSNVYLNLYIHSKPNLVDYVINFHIGKKNYTQDKIKPWFSIPKNNTARKVIVVGGGISGASTAYSLAKRGYKVTLYEKQTSLALGASGNYQSMLYANFLGDYTPMIELSLAGYKYSYYLINLLLEKEINFSQCGLIQLANSEIEQSRQQRAADKYASLCYLLDKTQIFQKVGYKINNNFSSLFFPHGLWLDLPCLINRLVTHKNITIKLSEEVLDLSFDNNFWHIITRNNYDSANNIVLCNAYAVSQFTQLKNLYLRKIRGQTTVIKGSNNLKTVLCNKGYITPNFKNHYTLGASFDFKNLDDRISDMEHLDNIRGFKNILPNDIALSNLGGKVSFRASTIDYMPIVGPIAQYELLKEQYKKLSLDANFRYDEACAYLPGIYINAAHGAKGVVTAPISSEIIADYIDNTLPCCSIKLQQALHVNRFWIKELIKNGT